MYNNFFIILNHDFTTPITRKPSDDILHFLQKSHHAIHCAQLML